MKKKDDFNALEKLEEFKKDIFFSGTNFKLFLKSYAYLYKHKIHDVILIHSQDKEVKQIGTYEQWKKTNRGVRKGCKYLLGMPTVDSKSYSYMFPISETYIYKDKISDIKIWSISQEDSNKIINNSDTENKNISEYIDNYLDEHFEEKFTLNISKDCGSLIEEFELTDIQLKKMFKYFIEASAKRVVSERCNFTLLDDREEYLNVALFLKDKKIVDTTISMLENIISPLMRTLEREIKTLKPEFKIFKDTRQENVIDEKHKNISLDEILEDKEEDSNKISFVIEKKKTEVIDEDYIENVINEKRLKEVDINLPKNNAEKNILAIKTIKNIEGDNRLATENEKLILSNYVGWGGLSKVFEQSNTYYSQIKDLLTDEEYIDARKSTLTSFYTPNSIIKSMYKVFENNGLNTGKILEPSMGIGRFYNYMPQTMREMEKHGVELDNISGRIAKALYNDVTVEIKGFEDTNYNDNTFDAVIGNVPFGEFKVLDEKYKKENYLIHDYFFVKALDKVKVGGVVAFITSKGTLDKANSDAREYLSQKANLVGAIRLPNNAFKEAGTKATTDILFLQKKDELSKDDNIVEWVQTEKVGEHNLNKYFIDNPHMILGDIQEVSGRFGTSLECIAHENSDIEKELNNAIEHINFDVVKTQTVMIEENIQNEVNMNELKEYSFSVVDDKVYYLEGNKPVLKDLKHKDVERLKGLVEIREKMLDIIDLQVRGISDEEVFEHLKDFNNTYDEFVKKYNYINSRTNKSLFKDDNKASLVSSLEEEKEYINGKKYYEKSDFFSKLTIKKRQEVISVDNIIDGLKVSYSNKGYVDIDDIAMLSNVSNKEVLEELLNKEIFLNPKNNNYEIKALYLSGEVRDKLAYAEHYADKDKRFLGNVKALEEVQPIDLKANQIDVRLGTSWIEAQDYKKFMCEILDLQGYKADKLNIVYSEYTNEYKVVNDAYNNSILATQTFGTNRVDAYKLMEESLNQRFIKVYDPIKDGDYRKYVVNKDETQLALMKQEEMKEKFKNWIFRDSERRQKYVGYYNDYYNNTVETHYDGSHLSFPDMNGNIELRPHQKDAIARTLYSGKNTLLAHSVGAGKTYEMISSAMEQKRIGLIKKPMFVVPNHLTGEFGVEFAKLYPTKNVLVTTKKDFETSNRKRFVSRIVTGNYDAVIIGHSQFGKIPVSPEREKNQLKKQVQGLMIGISKMKSQEGMSWSIKQMEIQKHKLETRLKSLGDLKRDDVINFEELGVDALIVDEAHEFKNLSIMTKMRGVAGISNKGSKKATDMLMKVQYINEINNNRGVVFATGTPISNALPEMYVIQKYLQSDELEKLGIHYFDNWCSTFGDIKSEMELAPEGTGYLVKTRLSHFVNRNELSSMFRDFADVKTKKDLDLKIPTLKNNKYNIVVAEPSQYIKDNMEDYAHRATAIRTTSVDPKKDNMLKIMNEARAISVDQRLVYPFIDDYVGSKTSICIDNVYNDYVNSNDIKGTQIIFCDKGVPKGSNFNLYEDIKLRLIQKGVNEKEIAFIHDYETEKAKDNLFKQMRTGEKRILLGTTQKMGTGMNVQDRLVSLHHMDCPWRPSDIEQREGRILRQGNMNSEVEIYRYTTKGTLDAFAWQTVEIKQKFIDEIMTGNYQSDSTEFESSSAEEFALMKASGVEDPLIKEKMEVENKISNLEKLKKVYQENLYQMEDNINIHYPKKIQTLEDKIYCVSEDIALKNANNNLQGFRCVVDDVTYDKPKEAGTIILSKLSTLEKDTGKVIGSYKGFDISVERTFTKAQISLIGKDKHTIDIPNTPIGTGKALENILLNLEDKEQDYIKTLKEVKHNLIHAKEEVQKPFSKQDELESLIKRKVEVDVEIDARKDERNFDEETNIKDHHEEINLDDELEM